MVCRLSGEDGNAFAIMGRVKKALEQVKVQKEKVDAYLADAMSGDYNNLLNTSMRHLELNGIDWE